MNSHVSGALSVHPEWSETLCSFGIEAAWRMGRWDSLDKFTSKPHTPTFESMIGKIFLAAKAHESRDERLMKLNAEFRCARQSVVPQLAAAGMESYRRAYDSVLKLHVLFELESFITYSLDSILEDASSLGRLLDTWDKRLKLMAPALRTQVPVLNLRRVLLHDLSSIISEKGRRGELVEDVLVECGRIWTQTARLLQKS